MKKSFLYFFISHHYPENYERCYTIKIGRRSIPFCARCIGLYPTLIIFLILQLGFLKISPNNDFLFLFLFPLPAFIEWGGRKIEIWKSSNFLRTLTGILFGIGISRGFYYYFQNLLHPLAWIQWFYFLILFLIIFIFVKLQNKKKEDYYG